MQETLPHELVAEIEELVKSGDYHDSAEVVAEALLVLKKQRQLEALRAAVAIGEEGYARGDYAMYMPELLAQMERNAMRKLAEGHEPNPDVCP
jgi:putative addiction module CopG family antidote